MTKTKKVFRIEIQYIDYVYDCETESDAAAWFCDRYGGEFGDIQRMLVITEEVDNNEVKEDDKD